MEKFNFTDAAAEVNAVAKQIKDGNLADVIIAVIHEGSTADNSAAGPIMDITNKLSNVNAVFGGHSHTELHVTSTNG
ncbi:MAG: bifunctional metallophosphatase/5'-nucleotidase, partial [Bacillota bacterium]|nr:bifunctional metallophosphatase/5'-nucleotidase [Bacillota bacterium]